MKKVFALLLACMLTVAMPLVAFADAALVETRTLENSAYLAGDGKTYYQRGNGGYNLHDMAGNVLAGPFGSITSRQDGRYYEVVNENGLNTCGVIDNTGAQVLPMSYGDVSVLSDDWLVGVVLEPTTDVKGDYKDSAGNQYHIARADVVYRNQIIGSLTRADFPSITSCGAVGPYMYVRMTTTTGFWLDNQFNRVDVSSDNFTSREFQDTYGKGILHTPTQTWAFTAGCTLTADQVEQSVWYNDNGDFVDLQGNVISQGPSAYEEYSYVSYDGGDYMVTTANSKRGLVNLQGEEIIPAVYKYMGGNGEDHFASGYQAVIDDNGCLSYLDLAGNVTASVTYQLTDSDYKGFSYNAPMVTVQNMGKYLVITATAGELPTQYEEATTVRSGAQKIMAVKLNGLWGCIDMSGNTVVPFELKSSPDISNDGTIVVGQTESREYKLYVISYDDAVAPAVEGETVVGFDTVVKMSGQDGPTVVEDSASADQTADANADPEAWTCTNCQTANTGKFCTECGTAKPSNACTSCGYVPQDGSTPKFCPECGTKF